MASPIFLVVERVRAARSTLIERLRRDDGFTLIELLVVMAMGIVIFGATVGFYQVVVNRTADTTARANTLGASRTAMERITRDIREGKSATIGGGGSSLTIVTPTARVIYSCTSGSCTRSTQTLAGAATGTPERVIGNLNTSTIVFASVTLVGAPHASVRVTLNSTPEGRETPIALTEDATVRNDCITYSLLAACT